jgi:hypothetical protein
MSNFFEAAQQHNWTPPKQKEIRLYYDEAGTILENDAVDVDFIEERCYIVITDEVLGTIQRDVMKVVDKKIIKDLPKKSLWYLKIKDIDEYNPYFNLGER